MMAVRSTLAMAIAAVFLAGHVAQAAEPAAGAADAALIKRGEYVAILGDCVACHTANGGPAMAGGRDLVTPFGKVAKGSEAGGRALLVQGMIRNRDAGGRVG